MSTPTDEAAADSAQDAGDRHRTAGAALPKLWACEPARWKDKGESTYRWYWLDVPPILFASPWPTCDRCGFHVRWMGPPERRGELLVYQVMCLHCHEVKEDGQEYVVIDETEVDFPLRIGGTAAWWKQKMRVDV